MISDTEGEQSLPPQNMISQDIDCFKLIIFMPGGSGITFDLPSNCLKEFNWKACSKKELCHR